MDTVTFDDVEKMIVHLNERLSGVGAVAASLESRLCGPFPQANGAGGTRVEPVGGGLAESLRRLLETAHERLGYIDGSLQRAQTIVEPQNAKGRIVGNSFAGATGGIAYGESAPNGYR